MTLKDGGGSDRFNSRRLLLPLAVVVLLIAAHGVILSYVSAHLSLSAVILSGLIMLVVGLHLGFGGQLHGRLRHRRRSN